MTDWVIGIDTHRYSGLMNYQTAYTAGARFVLARCGGGYTDTGLPFTDSQWSNNVVNAPPIIPCFGAWWYMTGVYSSIRAQATHCAGLLIPYKDKLPLGFWLDCERWLPGKTAAENRDMVLLFINTFESLAGLPVRGIYTRQSVWDAYVAPHARLSALDLWAARYNPTLSSPWGDGRFKFRDWNIYKFWQFTADGNGLGQTYGAPPPPAADADMDMDRWFSDLKSLYLYGNLILPEKTIEERLTTLEQEARAHGWNVGAP